MATANTSEIPGTGNNSQSNNHTSKNNNTNANNSNVNNNTANNNNANNSNKKRITSKRVVAMAGVVLLVMMYLVTLALAIFDNSASGSLFMLSLCCTLVIPIIVFVYSWMWARLTGKKAVGDPEDTEQ